MEPFRNSGWEFRTEIEHTALVGHVTDRPVHANVVGGDIDETGFRIERHRLPVLAADQIRTDVLGGMPRTRTPVRIFDRPHGLDVP